MAADVPAAIDAEGTSFDSNRLGTLTEADAAPTMC
jgi:hypothetical protein